MRPPGPPSATHMTIAVGSMIAVWTAAGSSITARWPAGRAAPSTLRRSRSTAAAAATSTGGVRSTRLARLTRSPIKFDGNVLFILIDTLRADRLGGAGQQQRPHDEVAQTARAALRFRRRLAAGASDDRLLGLVDLEQITVVGRDRRR